VLVIFNKIFLLNDVNPPTEAGF